MRALLLCPLSRPLPRTGIGPGDREAVTDTNSRSAVRGVEPEETGKALIANDLPDALANVNSNLVIVYVFGPEVSGLGRRSRAATAKYRRGVPGRRDGDGTKSFASAMMIPTAARLD